MTEKVIDYNKTEVNATPIKEWKDLENTELMDLLAIGADIDPEFYQITMKKIPKLNKQVHTVAKINYKTVKQTLKASKRTKKYYYKVSKALMKLIKSDQVASELKVELIELLKEITIKIEACDERDKLFLNEQNKKTMRYTTVALLTVAAIYGVVTNKK